MQRPAKLFIILFFAFFSQSIETHGQDLFTLKADSLFSEKKYSEAANLYEELLVKHSINRKNAYLKLAYIHEQSGDFVKSIYYLSELYQIEPTGEIFSKISRMADENSFSGYGRSDLNFMLLIYKQYFIWICLAIIVLIGYSFFVLVQKRLRNEHSALRHKISFVFLCILCLAFLNFENSFEQAIVKNQSVNLRKAPSAGAEIGQILPEGSRVNIIGQKDIWLRLIINGKIQFGKKSDFWIIDQK